MLGDEIRRYRKSMALDQFELGEALHVSQATIASWENGTRRPSIDTIIALAKFFNISTDTLLGVEKNDETEEERELWEARERARRHPECRTLFKLAKNGSIQDVRQVNAFIQAMKATNPDFYDGDDPA